MTGAAAARTAAQEAPNHCTTNNQGKNEHD